MNIRSIQRKHKLSANKLSLKKRQQESKERAAKELEDFLQYKREQQRAEFKKVGKAAHGLVYGMSLASGSYDNPCRPL